MLTLNTLNCIIRLINWYLVLWTQAFYASNFHFFKEIFEDFRFFFPSLCNSKTCHNGWYSCRFTVLLSLTSYDTPLSVPASQGIRSWTTFWAQPHSFVQRSSADSPTFQSGLGPNMVRKDMRWRVRSTENSADGAARLRKKSSWRREC